MIPRVARKGHSFKGAGLYYLQDVHAETSDRVDWTHTINCPTEDPEKALKWMTFTSMNAELIKKRHGTSLAGRKRTSGTVYSYSLSWHPEENPDKAHMLQQAYASLDKLGLSEHEAVVIAHDDKHYKHIHIITNLVNPQTGKLAKTSYDRLKLSEYAQAYEERHGIYCTERIENNTERARLNDKTTRAKRRKNAQEQGRNPEQNESTGIVKYREKKHAFKEKIRELYLASNTGKAFQSALNEHDIHLCKGDKRGFVLVSRDGSIHSLSRQLSGITRGSKTISKMEFKKEYKHKMSDIEQQDLPDANELSNEFKANKEHSPGQVRDEEPVRPQDEERKGKGSGSRAIKPKKKEKPKQKIKKPVIDRSKEEKQARKEEVSQQVLQSYQHSDNAQSFRVALGEHGLNLARGDQRPYVIIDRSGIVYGLRSEMVGQNQNAIHQRLGDPEQYPRVQDVLKDLEPQNISPEFENRAAKLPNLKEEFVKGKLKDKARHDFNKSRDEAEHKAQVEHQRLVDDVTQQYETGEVGYDLAYQEALERWEKSSKIHHQNLSKMHADEYEKRRTANERLKRLAKDLEQANKPRKFLGINIGPDKSKIAELEKKKERLTGQHKSMDTWIKNKERELNERLEKSKPKRDDYNRKSEQERDMKQERDRGDSERQFDTPDIRHQKRNPEFKPKGPGMHFDR